MGILSYCNRSTFDELVVTSGPKGPAMGMPAHVGIHTDLGFRLFPSRSDGPVDVRGTR
jgi:hypothetical protein